MAERDRILVAYGTKYGATAEIAEAIGETLRAAGLEVDVERARQVRSLDRYRAVVIGSAVYTARWRSDAQRLLARPELRERDVWVFSSGPVGEDPDDPVQAERWMKPKRVRELADAIGAHDHVVFGGMVDEERGFMRRKMARNTAPQLRDRRDWHAIDRWARAIAETLTPENPAAR